MRAKPHKFFDHTGQSANWAITAFLTSSCGWLYTGMQWKCLPVPHDTDGQPAIHYTTVYRVFAKWADDGSLWQAFVASVAHLAKATRPQYPPWRRDEHRGQKRGDGIGYSGHKHQKGEKVIAIIDNHGYVLAPVPVAPVNETDMVLLPEGLKALKKMAKEVGLDLNGAYLNLDGGFDSIANRKCIFEFIPIMVYWASHERRHHVCPVYGSLMCRPAPRSSWISR